MARGRVVLTADVVGAAGTNFQPATGMSVNVIVGRKYHFRIVGISTAAATTTGVVWGLSASPTTAPTLVAMIGMTATGAGTLAGGGAASYVTTAATTGSITAPTDIPATAGALSVYEYIVVPSATQVVTVEFRSEAAAATTAKAGSYVDWEEL